MDDRGGMKHPDMGLPGATAFELRQIVGREDNDASAKDARIDRVRTDPSRARAIAIGIERIGTVGSNRPKSIMNQTSAAQNRRQAVDVNAPKPSAAAIDRRISVGQNAFGASRQACRNRVAIRDSLMIKSAIPVHPERNIENGRLNVS
jgi:hypothetical protein